MKELINNKDYEGIKKALSQNPSLANEGIPFDKKIRPKPIRCTGFVMAYLPILILIRKPLKWRGSF
jgi:hypothetical protein